MTAIAVNGIEIGVEAVAAEAQNHPATDPDEAWTEAARALAVRELLLQEARRQALEPEPAIDDEGRRETEEEALIRALMDSEIEIPEADEASCRRYYENNRHRFTSPTLYEPAHILLSADPAEEARYAEAGQRAEALIATLARHPEAFGDLAREHSDCPSAKDGGHLGQVETGQTTPEFETFLVSLEPGQLCPVPVKTAYGVHVLRLDRRVEGRVLPFEAVAGRIADFLREASYRRAAAQYIRILAGRARIEGIDLAGTDSPLVQ